MDERTRGFPRQQRNVDSRAWRGSIPMGHTYTMGVAGEEFFRRLRDDGEISATVHRGAAVAILPPRLYHPDSFAPIDRWVTVGPEGTVDTFTIVARDRRGQPYAAPRVLAVIRIDGAEGGLLHWVGGCDPAAVTIGMRVEAVFEPKNKRTGTLSDIRHFAPTRG